MSSYTMRQSGWRLLTSLYPTRQVWLRSISAVNQYNRCLPNARLSTETRASPFSR